MEKLLHSHLSELFARAFAPLSLVSRFSPEKRIVLDGTQLRADVYEWSLTGQTFELVLRRISPYGGFLSKSKEVTACTLNDAPIPSFEPSEVEKLLKETGWKCAITGDVEENSERRIERSEEGRELWWRSLPYFRAGGVEMVLDYFPENEGSYVMTLSVLSDIPIDTDRKMRLEIGFRDWRTGAEPSHEFRSRLADILRYWMPYVDALGFESPDVVDFYTILTEIVEHGENERLHHVLRKERDQRLHGETESITPRDFSWWRHGIFSDTPSQRRTFMDWWQSLAARNDGKLREALAEFGLGPDAGAGEIRNAYRKKIRAFHPDIIGSKGLDPAFLSFAEKETERLTALYEWIMSELR